MTEKQSQPVVGPDQLRHFGGKSGLMESVISNWLRDLGTPWFVLIILIASYVVLLPLVPLVYFFPWLIPGPGSQTMQSLGLLPRLIVGSLIVPFLETGLFQWAPIRFLRGKLKLPWPLTIGLSALLFGSAHFYSIGYFAFGCLVGLVFAYGYAVREPKQMPFLSISVAHGLRNAVASIIL